MQPGAKTTDTASALSLHRALSEAAAECTLSILQQSYGAVAATRPTSFAIGMTVRRGFGVGGLRHAAVAMRLIILRLQEEYLLQQQGRMPNGGQQYPAGASLHIAPSAGCHSLTTGW